MLYIWEHFSTVCKHRHKVIAHCYRCGILWQGLIHDLSKFSPTEFSQGVKYYRSDRSPNVGEREVHGYSKAWLHHQGRNKHHFEYWYDYNIKTRQREPVEMPVRYVVEMFCDRVAASKIYYSDEYNDSKALEYFEKGQARKRMHERTGKQLEKLLKMLAEKGEKETFEYIKNVVKPKTKYNGMW